MDRSFLSQAGRHRRLARLRLHPPGHLRGSRGGRFLKAFHVTRSGELENTVFTLLSPDGKRQLRAASGGADDTFGDATRMATAMVRIARDYSAPEAGGPPPELPKVANVRLAVDVAACDNQPLVLVFGQDASGRKKLEDRLAAARLERPLPRALCVSSASSAAELAALEGARAEAGILVIQPDKFGLQGKVLAKAAAGTRDELVRCLTDGARLYQRQEKTFAGHVREGQQRGVFWETQLPVTDPMELARAASAAGAGGSPAEAAATTSAEHGARDRRV